MDDYTHEYNISLGEDGGQFMNGQFTVDKTEKKARHNVETASDPLPLEFMEDAVKLIRTVADLLVKYEGIKSIKFEQK